jgi:hypothetical protein
MSVNQRKSARRFQPWLEALEDRQLLACDFLVGGANLDRLTITGLGNGNIIRIVDDGTKDAGNIEVNCDGLVSTFDNIKFITVNAGDGGDTVLYELTGPLISNRKLGVLLGEDDDTFRTQIRQRIESAFRLTILGEDGEDRVTTEFNRRVLGRFLYAVDGGDDDDNLFAQIAAAKGSTGTIEATAAGGDGDNEIALLLYVKGTATATGLIDGGGGDSVCVHTANVLAFNCETDIIV